MNSSYFHIDKKCKKTRKILKIIDSGDVFIVNGKELLYKYSTILKARGTSYKYNKFCLYEDRNGNYINEWFWREIVYGDSMGTGLKEFPSYTTANEKLFVVKYNNKIIADRKM